MTLDLDAIRRRAEAATPGPWKCLDAWGPPIGAPHYERAMRRIGSPIHGGGVRGYADTLLRGIKDAECYAYEADAEFIAHAREDIPALLDEVTRLRELLALERPEHSDSQPDPAVRAHDDAGSHL